MECFEEQLNMALSAVVFGQRLCFILEVFSSFNDSMKSKHELRETDNCVSVLPEQL